MGGDTRSRMIDGAARLLAQRGLQQTSFAEVIELTGAPRGSIYHHFPEGKDQLVGLAVDRAGEVALSALERLRGEPASIVVATFLDLWRQVLVRSGFSAGCSVLAVTVATDSADLLERAARVFREWRILLSSLLTDGGIAESTAPGLAVTLIAATEGAVVISRAEQSIEPFEAVAARLTAEALTAEAQRASG